MFMMYDDPYRFYTEQNVRTNHVTVAISIPPLYHIQHSLHHNYTATMVLLAQITFGCGYRGEKNGSPQCYTS